MILNSTVPLLDEFIGLLIMLWVCLLIFILVTETDNKLALLWLLITFLLLKFA
jgi:hypothetical protein